MWNKKIIEEHNYTNFSKQYVHLYFFFFRSSDKFRSSRNTDQFQGDFASFFVFIEIEDFIGRDTYFEISEASKIFYF